jgi:hypothetical protein
MPPPALLVVVHEREDVHTGELVAAVEEVEFDGDCEADDLAGQFRSPRVRLAS